MAQKSGGGDLLSISISTIAVLAAGAAFFFGYSLNQTQQDFETSMGTLKKETSEFAQSAAQAQVDAEAIEKLKLQFAALSQENLEMKNLLKANTETFSAFEKLVEDQQLAIGEVESSLESIKSNFKPLETSLSKQGETIGELVLSMEKSFTSSPTEIASPELDQIIGQHKDLTSKINSIQSEFDLVKSGTSELNSKLGKIESASAAQASMIENILGEQKTMVSQFTELKELVDLGKITSPEKEVEIVYNAIKGTQTIDSENEENTVTIDLQNDPNSEEETPVIVINVPDESSQETITNASNESGNSFVETVKSLTQGEKEE